jgi:hypothetical protein
MKRQQQKNKRTQHHDSLGFLYLCTVSMGDQHHMWHALFGSGYLEGGGQILFCFSRTLRRFKHFAKPVQATGVRFLESTFNALL